MGHLRYAGPTDICNLRGPTRRFFAECVQKISAAPKSIRATGIRSLALGESLGQGIYFMSKMYIPPSDTGNV